MPNPKRDRILFTALLLDLVTTPNAISLILSGDTERATYYLSDLTQLTLEQIEGTPLEDFVELYGVYYLLPEVARTEGYTGLKFLVL